MIYSTNDVTTEYHSGKESSAYVLHKILNSFVNRL